MDEIRFVDTTLRDGHQSLWAERMTTGMMLPVARTMDEAGFDAIELMSASHLKKCVRELKEDPWDRVRMVAERITRTPLRLMAGRVNAFEITPVSVYELFIERMAANGIRQARISEEWNELEGWQRKVGIARKNGLSPSSTSSTRCRRNTPTSTTPGRPAKPHPWTCRFSASRIPAAC